MSVLGEQIKELREAAERLEGYQCGDISRMLREAADTIESLRDRLQELQDVGGGECELDETDSYSNAGEVVHVLECSACGRTCEHVNGSYPKCPHCGRKAVKR